MIMSQKIRKVKAMVMAVVLFAVLCPETIVFADVKADDIPEKCTAIYVGKDVSVDGTRIIARSEDQDRGVWGKRFYVVPASEKGSGKITETGIEDPLSVEIPRKTYKYTALADQTGLGIGPYYAHCMNECGLAVTATVSTEVSREYEEIDPLKDENRGMHEAIIAAVLACQCETAEKAVHTMASYIDRYGSSEWNTLLLSDKKEAWIFEIYGGSSYAAMRLPDDQMAVFGNQVMLQWIDFENLDGFVVSENLQSFLDKTANPVMDEEGRYNIAKTVTGCFRDDYSNLRTWRGHQLFAPSKTGTYETDEFYTLLFTPDYKVSVLDLMKVLGDRYEGTEFDMEKEGNEELRPIGTVRQSDVSIIQTFEELPDCCCQLQWLAMGNAEHCVFIPAFSGISDTYEKYKVEGETPETVNDGFYYMSRKNAALAETDREYLGEGLKDFNREQEEAMYDRIMDEIPVIAKQYEKSDKDGEEYVTKLAESMAAKQYSFLEKINERLAYVQSYNMSDGKEKIRFSAKSIDVSDSTQPSETMENGRPSGRSNKGFAAVIMAETLIIVIETIVIVRKAKSKEDK